MFHLANDQQELTVNELSKTLNIKMPSVNSMMKKFSEKNWVKYESYKPLILTDEGRKLAALVVRKHRLTEMFLVEKMNFGWEQVHQIAEQVEHIQSDVFFDKMDELLDYPQIDPHGSPIPDKNGNLPIINHRILHETKISQKLKLCGVLESSEAFLVYLNKRNINIGTILTVIEKESFDQSMVVRVNQKNIPLSADVCQKLLVKIL